MTTRLSPGWYPDLSRTPPKVAWDGQSGTPLPLPAAAKGRRSRSLRLGPRSRLIERFRDETRAGHLCVTARLISALASDEVL